MSLTPEIRQYVAEALHEMTREVQRLRGLFCFTVNGEAFELPVEHYGWQEVPGTGGVEMCALPVTDWPADPLPNSDYFMTRGPGGIRRPLLKMEQALQVEMLQGEAAYWKQSAPGYRTYGPGDKFTLEPGEPYGWRSITPFLHRVAFTPRITQLAD